MNLTIRKVTIADYDAIYSLWCSTEQTLRTNLNYRNKSLNAGVPQGE